MTSSQLKLVHNKTGQEKKKKGAKFNWYWAPAYCVLWFALFCVAVIPSFYNYPETLRIHDEISHADEFIGERAETQLLKLSNIGVKLVGSVENEILAVDFLLEEIEKIKIQARLDLYDFEVEVQHATGEFALYSTIMSYHNVTNVVVKLAPKNVIRASYLLVNAHFDSVVGSRGAADDGVMVVIMLETLRVISKSERLLLNPIIFLFNGAEEVGLLASHGFITKHRWAQYCKAFINLDSAGSGGREILFQSGPNHPWLMEYYKSSVPRPYGNTIAEELFQNNFVPSDTDFRIFRDYGKLPGLDMAHTLNGYIYHTKFDTYQNLEPRTCQTTGENVLALIWSLANAPELSHPEDFAEGHTVFFDYLGWFMIFYTESTGILINITTSVMALIVISTSVFLMSRDMNVVALQLVLNRFFVIFLVQVVTILVAASVTFLIALTIDGIDASECWYSETWLLFGLYFCPMFFVMCFLPALYIGWTKAGTRMHLDNTLACFMHSHCIILVILCLVLTGLGIRSAYFPMIAILFYTISVILNIANRFCGKAHFYLPIHLLFQLLPYWFYTYLTLAFLKVFIPMQGRSGPTSMPELLISSICIIASIHFTGFILPILHKFQKSMSFINLFGVFCLAFIMIACLPIGFPYKPDVAAQRINVVHTNCVLHDKEGFAYRNESSFYVQHLDKRINTLQDTVFNNAPGNTISREVFCGVPLFSAPNNTYRWLKAESPHIPVLSKLKLTSKDLIEKTRLRYQFSLKSLDRAVIYVEPYPNAKVVDWSFDKTPLRSNSSAPYTVNHIDSMVEKPFEFWIEIDRVSADYEGPSLRIGVLAHFLHHEAYYTDEFRRFLDKFPKWSHPTHWFSSFESHIF